MKIQIKTILGSVLFEYDCESNTLAKTIMKAKNQGADLRGANLTCAKIQTDKKEISIDKIRYFSGLYKYDCACILSDKGHKYIKLGCFTRSVTDWKKDFWNNDNEFPNDNSKSSKRRLVAYKSCLNYFELL